MSKTVPGTLPWLTLERLGFFSDGVVAIIITILVLEIHIPEGHDFAADGAMSFLWKAEHGLKTYLVSFFLILTYWLQHHVIFHYLARTDRSFVFLNGVFLFFLSLTPFTNAMALEYRGVHVVESIFSITYFLSGMALWLMWWYATRDARLLRQPIDAVVRRSISRRILIAPILSLVGLAVAFFEYPLAAFVYLSIPLFYLKHWIADVSWRTE